MRRKKKGNDFRSKISIFACNINWPEAVEIKLDFIYLLLKIPIIKKIIVTSTWYNIISVKKEKYNKQPLFFTVNSNKRLRVWKESCTNIIILYVLLTANFFIMTNKLNNWEKKFYHKGEKNVNLKPWSHAMILIVNTLKLVVYMYEVMNWHNFKLN